MEQNFSRSLRAWGAARTDKKVTGKFSGLTEGRRTADLDVTSLAQLRRGLKDRVIQLSRSWQRRRLIPSLPAQGLNLSRSSSVFIVGIR